MKLRYLIFTLLSLCLALTACQSTAPAASSPPAVVVGFSQLGSESGWRIGNTASMEQAAKRWGFGLMLDNANQRQDKQIAAIRSFISYQVDVIVFSPIVETGWDNVLREARQAGIPVILTDRMVDVADDTLYTAYIGADFLAEGRRAGEFLIKKADALGAEHLNIVEITGTEDSTPMRDRQAGFLQAIAGDGRFTVLESITGDFLRSKGRECMRSLLDKYGAAGIDVVYSHNDAMTLGALDVLDEAGVVPGRDIVLISVDGEQAAVDELVKGRINCIVECTPHLGDDVMAQVDALTKGRTIPKTIHPEETVFTEFDDLTGIGPRGY
ncbi:MAG: ABC transporter substrate-binding protein [Clostridia bacterium]|nr:ABC transporter substrate-binding protein [Clostridia bacterium]MBQ6120221.1 ABC transporter substrate-binding protein [Clostridia bacterium]